MNKYDILKKISEYNFDVDSFIIISGAAMVLYGIRENTNDIDIAVSLEYYKKLFKDYNPKLEKEFKDRANSYMIGDYINFSTNFYSNKFVLIDGYRVQTLEELINLKKKLNRQKDIEDLKLIKKLNYNSIF